MKNKNKNIPGQNAHVEKMIEDVINNLYEVQQTCNIYKSFSKERHILLICKFLCRLIIKAWYQQVQ